MSPRNWRDCPQCHVRAEHEHLDSKQKLADAYGKIPLLEYEHRKARLDAIELPLDTMREDYELGVDGGGMFEMYFHCSCTKCDFEFSFTHSEQIDLTIPDSVV